ncbi:MAG: FAD-dependent oxidoreductase, partial [Actinobacteria bacterium]|nr:FAD-dependent oxidoreductase [Actinomycetota bacterium]
YRRMLEFCAQQNIPHEVCGKVVVAVNDAQVPQLDELERRGHANGLSQIRRLSPQEIKEREPHCTGIAGLYVPYTGIVDYAVVGEAMRNRVESLGGHVSFGQFVTGITEHSAAARVDTRSDEFVAKHVVTCGGLQSDRLARHTIEDLDLRILPFRGEYFVLRESAKRLVRNLIYPVPNPAFPFLGVHFTRIAAPAGVRAQACDNRGNLLDDFALRESTRVTHVCNAPSPAATASLAIGEYIATRVGTRLSE